MRKILMASCILVSLSVISVLYFAKIGEEKPAKPGNSLVRAGLDIPFVKNKGQARGDVAFYTGLKGGALFVKHDGSLVYSLAGKKEGVFTSIVERPRKYAAISLEGRDPADVRLNYFKGRDRKKWRSNVPSFKSVSLGRLAPDIDMDLVYRPGTCEKIFRVRPGGDPAGISMRIDGARKITALPDGRLEVKTALGEVLFSKPAAHQNINGKRSEVEVAYRVSGGGYGFTVGEYDASHGLVIDPILSTFVGGSGEEYGRGLATYHTGVGNLMYIFVTGSISDITGFPAAHAPGDVYGTTGGGGDYDAFVARVNYDLSYYTVTYLGGSERDEAFDVAVNPENGLVYVVGFTSGDFPMTGSTNVGRGGLRDAFVACLSNDLSTLEYSRYLGGSSNDAGVTIAIESGRLDEVPDLVYVAGSTASSDFPGTTGAPQEDCASCTALEDGFAAVLDTELGLIRSTYLGGCSTDSAYAIAVSPLDHAVYVAGNTSYNGPWLVEHGGEYVGCFPWTPGPYSFKGNATDAFIVRFSDRLQTTDTPVAWYIGGNGMDSGYGLAVDPSTGAVYLAGRTTCGTAGTNDAGFTFPGGSYTPAYENCAGGLDAFIVRFDSDLEEITAATLFGGSSNDCATDIDLFGSSVYLLGYTDSTNLPDTDNAAVQNALYTDVMLASMSTDLTEGYQATYLGGDGTDSSYYHGLEIVNDPNTGALYALVTGHTSSDDFPGIPDTDIVYQHLHGGGSYDAFVTKISASFLYAEGPRDIDVDPPLVDIGNWPTGTTNAGILEINNMGADPLTITNISLQTGDNFWVGSSGSCTIPDESIPTVLTLDGGGSCTVHVYFEPPAVGEFGDILNIISDDEDEGWVQVGFAGRCYPDIMVTPPASGTDPHLEFPDTAVGSNYIEEFTITNEGVSALSVTGVDTSTTAFTAEFSGIFPECRVTPTPAEPLVITPHRYCTVKVRYSPPDVDDHTGYATVHSDDPDESDVIVNLSGEGVNADRRPRIVQAGLNFRDVAVGSERTLMHVIANEGGTPLQIRGFDFSAPLIFSVNGSLGAVPCTDTDWVIAPDEYCTAGIVFSPAEENDSVNETVTVATNDPAPLNGGTVILTGRSGLDTDGDGVLDIAESGDANGDGTDDAAQANVAAVTSFEGDDVVVLEAGGGATLEEARSDISFEGTPAEWQFPFGCFRFTLILPSGVTTGSVVLTVPDGYPISTYFKYGTETPGNTEFHPYDLGDYPGAVDIDGNRITLNLEDAGVGDSDLEWVPNGRIEDPGAPAYVRSSGHKSGGGGGCSSSAAGGGGQGETVYAGLILLFGWVWIRRRKIGREGRD